LNDIEHWQDEKEQNYKTRKAHLEKVANEAAKKKAAEERRADEIAKRAAKARADRKA
jgi:hypothetical protein